MHTNLVINELDGLPCVTAIVPCRNEATFIAQCVESILANDYPQGRLEILVIDGMSTDGTWAIVCDLAQRFPEIIPLRNKARSTPAALNLGIKSARGEIICRVDAHARIAPDYLRQCSRVMRKSGADNVGGSMETLPSCETAVARAIAAVMSHPFGVGDSHFRIRTAKAGLADTVFGGCYRRQVFERIGLFNENLVRTQDMEFNQRLRRAGGTIFLDPAIKSYYYACPDLASFCRHNFQDGMWSVLPFAYSDGFPVRWRHLAAAIFLMAIACSAISGIWLHWARVVLEAILCSYLAASCVSSMHAAWGESDYQSTLIMPVVFAVRHFAYGLGSLWGLGTVIARGSTLGNRLSHVKAGNTEMS